MVRTPNAAFWAGMVTMQTAAEKRKKGAFSATNFMRLLTGKRFSGQKSSSSRTKGSVTSMGLLISPRAKNNNAR